MNSYQGAIADGLEKMRVWAADKPELTDDVWKLPKDCPLWSLGLSLAQASGILAAIHYERKTGNMADQLDDLSDLVQGRSPMRSSNHSHFCPRCRAHKYCAQITHCRRPDESICFDCLDEIAKEGG